MNISHVTPNTSLWARRLALYFTIGTVVIVIMHVVFSYFGFLHTDVDSARYMLSALIQSEAAIVALVVTLSLVAVQLAASTYSTRMIGVFRRMPDLWILMVIYGGAMFYGLAVLKLIESTNPQICNKDFICLSNLEGHIAFSYYLGIFTFVTLVPYIWNMLGSLKPSTLIEILSEEITKQNILSADKKERNEKSETDPIQPIIYLIHGSLMRNDYDTVGYGFDAIINRTEHLFINEKFDDQEEERVSKHVLNHILEIGRLAASKGDENFTIDVINALFSIGVTVEKHKLEIASQMIAKYLGYVGEEAAKQKFESATFIAVDELGLLGEGAAGARFLHTSQQAITSLENVLEISKEFKFKDVIRRGEEALHEINKTLVKF